MALQIIVDYDFKSRLLIVTLKKKRKIDFRSCGNDK